MMWLCRPCDARVGCHENTRRPLGTMADKEMRAWRMKAHAVVDPLWRSGRYQRRQVYERLRDAFGEEVHIGASDIGRCKEIIETVPQIFLIGSGT